jgi:hypothetical protein
MKIYPRNCIYKGQRYTTASNLRYTNGNQLYITIMGVDIMGNTIYYKYNDYIFQYICSLSTFNYLKKEGLWVLMS